MKRFKFSLESVLTVRRNKLVDEQTKFASILSVYNQQKDKLNKIFEIQNEVKNESENYLLGENVNPSIISNYSGYIKKLQDDIKVQNEILKETKEVLDNQQNLVKEAYIKVKSLENLKDKHKEQYLKEMQSEEIKEIDDIVNSRRNIA